jgi:hypothetical protein
MRKIASFFISGSLRALFGITVYEIEISHGRVPWQAR